MTAALGLANQGYKVYLVEKSSELGGNLRHLRYVLTDEDPQKELNEMIAKGYDEFIYRSDYLMNELVRSLGSRFRLGIVRKSMRYAKQIAAYIMEQSPWRRAGQSPFV